MPRSRTLVRLSSTLVLAPLMASVLGTATASAATLPALTAAVDPAISQELRAHGHADVVVDLELPSTLARSARGPGAAKSLGNALRPLVKDAKSALRSAVGTDGHTVAELPELATTVIRVDTPGALQRLSHHAGVASLTLAQRGSLSAAQVDPQSPSLVRQPSAAASGYRGAGTVVVDLDTGADTRQPALSGRVSFSADYAPDDGVADDNSHGTNTAGVIAMMAPDAKIWALDVFDRNPTTGKNFYDDTWLLNALNDTIAWKQQGYNIVAVNMSLGTSPTYSNGTCTSSFTNAFSQLRALGIVPVVAAGNEAVVNGTYRSGVSTPACTAGALSVGATYDQAGLANDCGDTYSSVDVPTCFSQSGPTLGMWAPGSWIEAAGVGMQGTSQATPHVAGAIAVLASAKPGASANALQSAVTGAGPVVTDHRSGVSRHRLDIVGALNALLGSGADRTAPTTTSPVQSIARLYKASTTVPVKMTWTGSDNVGVTGYELWLSVNGTWQQLSLASATSTSAVYNLATGNTYQLAVKARDAAGNVGAWAYGPTFTPKRAEDNAASVTYSGSWTRYASSSSSAGTAAMTSQAGATATFRFTGRNVAWVAPQATNRGSVQVYVDGTLISSVSQYATSTTYGVVLFSRTWAASGTHTVVIKNLATSGHPTVDVDQFQILA